MIGRIDRKEYEKDSICKHSWGGGAHATIIMWYRRIILYKEKTNPYISCKIDMIWKGTTFRQVNTGEIDQVENQIISLRAGRDPNPAPQDG